MLAKKQELKRRISATRDQTPRRLDLMPSDILCTFKAPIFSFKTAAQFALHACGSHSFEAVRSHANPGNTKLSHARTTFRSDVENAGTPPEMILIVSGMVTDRISSGKSNLIGSLSFWYHPIQMELTSFELCLALA